MTDTRRRCSCRRRTARTSATTRASSSSAQTFKFPEDGGRVFRVFTERRRLDRPSQGRWLLRRVPRGRTSTRGRRRRCPCGTSNQRVAHPSGRRRARAGAAPPTADGGDSLQEARPLERRRRVGRSTRTVARSGGRAPAPLEEYESGGRSLRAWRRGEAVHVRFPRQLGVHEQGLRGQGRRAEGAVLRACSAWTRSAGRTSFCATQRDGALRAPVALVGGAQARHVGARREYSERVVGIVQARRDRGNSVSRCVTVGVGSRIPRSGIPIPKARGLPRVCSMRLAARVAARAFGWAACADTRRERARFAFLEPFLDSRDRWDRAIGDRRARGRKTRVTSTCPGYGACAPSPPWPFANRSREGARWKGGDGPRPPRPPRPAGAPEPPRPEAGPAVGVRAASAVRLVADGCGRGRRTRRDRCWAPVAWPRPARARGSGSSRSRFTRRRSSSSDSESSPRGSTTATPRGRRRRRQPRARGRPQGRALTQEVRLDVRRSRHAGCARFEASDRARPDRHEKTRKREDKHECDGTCRGVALRRLFSRDNPSVASRLSRRYRTVPRDDTIPESDRTSDRPSVAYASSPVCIIGRASRSLSHSFSSSAAPSSRRRVISFACSVPPPPLLRTPLGPHVTEDVRPAPLEVRFDRPFEARVGFAQALRDGVPQRVLADLPVVFVALFRPSSVPMPRSKPGSLKNGSATKMRD